VPNGCSAVDRLTFIMSGFCSTRASSPILFDGPDGEKASPGFLARAMTWSLPASGSSATGFAIKTIGQTMITPDDIEEDPPILPPDDLPYGGLLFYSDTFVQIQPTYADKISVTIGVVGEPSLAEDAQKFVHDVISSEEPCCWDEQLDDEVVFQVSRGRVWKTWAADSGNADFLLSADLQLGTISSSVGAGFMVRYGAGLKQSYATALLAASRTINPVATQNGWYVFAGARSSYIGNQIFLDGSKSYDDDFEEIEYEENQVSVTMGLAYSWKDFSFTFAMNDLNVNEDSDNDSAEEFSEYGTLTAAWKLD
jgi:lipid A 3-O-deacylase